MEQALTLSQLVQAIAFVADDTIASTLFQELHGRIWEHYDHAYYSLCWNEYRLDRNSILAEEMYDKVLDETEQDIRERKFNGDRYKTDEALHKGLIAWMLWKADWRVETALRARKRKATNLADLSAGQQREFESVPSQDFSAMMDEGMQIAFEQLSEKDADFIRTYFCEPISKEEAQELLMQRYGIKTDAAFLQAVARAKRRFKEFLQNYKTERSFVS